MRRVPEEVKSWYAFLAVAAVLLVACSSDDTFTITADDADSVRIGDLPDPTEGDEPLPDNYRESVPRDAINPIYAPEFVPASEVDWPGDELVIGVEFDGDARAYPVGFLTFREMVIDNHRGIPTLVTW